MEMAANRTMNLQQSQPQQNYLQQQPTHYVQPQQTGQQVYNQYAAPSNYQQAPYQLYSLQQQAQNPQNLYLQQQHRFDHQAQMHTNLQMGESIKP